MVPVLPVLAREKYPVGSRVAVAVPPVRPKLRIPVTVAPERSTPLISMLNSDALVRLADVRRVRVRSAIPAPDISKFESAALERLTAGPTMKLLYIMYPVGNTVGGVAVTDALRRLPDTRFVKLAPDRSVPERSVPAMDIPDRSTDERAEFNSDTFGPTMMPFLNIYPAGNVAVEVPVRPAVRILVRVAPVKIAPDTSEFVKSIPERSALVRFALVIRTLFPKIAPPRPMYPGGKVAVASPITPRERILAIVAPVNVAPERSVDTNIALVKFVRFRTAPYRDTLVKLDPDRSAPK